MKTDGNIEISIFLVLKFLLVVNLSIIFQLILKIKIKYFFGMSL